MVQIIHLYEHSFDSVVFKEAIYYQDVILGSEFVAMKIGIESLRGLRYKLGMMGVEIYIPSNTYVNKISVIKNTQR